MTATPKGPMRVVVGAIIAALVALGAFAVGEVKQDGAETRRVVTEEQSAAHLDRLCLIDALHAITLALVGEHVDSSIPASCAAIVDSFSTTTTTP